MNRSIPSVIRGLLIAAALLLPLAAADHPMMPNPKLTPGALNPAVNQSTIAKTVCVPGYTAQIRNVSEAEKKQVMRNYGLPESDLSRTEIDHYLSLENGGANDITNLWPQYYDAAPGQKNYLGARDKDVVETHLHKLLCEGKITLRQDQDMLRDWVTVYRKLKGKQQ